MIEMQPVEWPASEEAPGAHWPSDPSPPHPKVSARGDLAPEPLPIGSLAAGRALEVSLKVHLRSTLGGFLY